MAPCGVGGSTFVESGSGKKVPKTLWTLCNSEFPSNVDFRGLVIVMSSSSSSSLTQKWLLDNVHSYPQSFRVYSDIDSSLSRFLTLRPKSDVYSSVIDLIFGSNR